nr:unnamed protein product [Callosobruchus analis]
MLFGPQNKRDVESDLRISINGVQIPIVDQARSLGVILYSELRFGPHITKLLQQTYAALKTIYASRSFLTLKVRINLCESLVLSILNYADIVEMKSVHLQMRETWGFSLIRSCASSHMQIFASEMLTAI